MTHAPETGAINRLRFLSPVSRMRGVSKSTQFTLLMDNIMPNGIESCFFTLFVFF